MMKKVLSLLLAVILLASLTLTASTAEEEVCDGYVIVRLCNEGELYYGDDIYLYASVKSANMPYTITWQRSTGTGWEDISGQHDEYYVFTATPESVNCEYRVVLTAK